MSYGWTEYLQENNLLHVTINPKHTRNIRILPQFRDANKELYLRYQADYDYTGSIREFYRSCQKITQTLEHRDTSILELQSDPLFRCKEWGQFMTLLPEIYLNGNRNIPTLRFGTDNELLVHPGNHLCYVMLFLGIPLRCFFHVSQQHREHVDKIAHVHETIWRPQQIQSILKTRDVEFWIEKLGDQHVPHIYPRISKDTSWKSYENGDCEWPWQLVGQWNRTHRDFDLNTATPLRKFSTTQQQQNHQLAFLLTGAAKDANFRLNATVWQRLTSKLF